MRSQPRREAQRSFHEAHPCSSRTAWKSTSSPSKAPCPEPQRSCESAERQPSSPRASRNKVRSRAECSALAAGARRQSPHLVGYSPCLIKAAHESEAALPAAALHHMPSQLHAPTPQSPGFLSQVHPATDRCPRLPARLHKHTREGGQLLRPLWTPEAEQAKQGFTIASPPHHALRHWPLPGGNSRLAFKEGSRKKEKKKSKATGRNRCRKVQHEAVRG